MTRYRSIGRYNARRVWFASLLPLIVLLLVPAGSARNGRTPWAAPAAQAQNVQSFLVNWTVTANGDGALDLYGTHREVRRQIWWQGSALVRWTADYQHQVVVFYQTTTDQAEITDTSTCAVGEYRKVEHWSINDSDRYMNYFPNLMPNPPVQKPDGTWYILSPFGAPGNYYYGHTIDTTYCGDNRESTDKSGIDSMYLDVLPNPSFSLTWDPTMAIYSGHLQFAHTEPYMPPLNVTWTATARPLAGRDLTVTHLEVTQTLQDASNSIPLVRGRRTVVRAFVGLGDDSGPVANVSGILRAYSGGTLLGAIPPFNPGGVINAIANPDWQQIDDTLDFELPYAWTLNPALHLEVEVNPARTVTEIDYDDNKLAQDVTTLACRPFTLGYLPIHYTPPSGFTPPDPDRDISAGQQFIRKVYPVADKGLKYKPYPGFTWYMEMDNDATMLDNADKLSAAVARHWVMSNPRPDRLIGWLPDGASSSVNGTADGIPGVAAWVLQRKYPDTWRATAAHEVGHTYGLEHNSLTTAGRHWFDVYERQIKPPQVTGGLFDFIYTPATPETHRWVSPESYVHLVNEFCPAGAASAATAGTSHAATAPPQPGTAGVLPAATTAGDNLVVTGSISQTSGLAGALDPLYRTATADTLIPPAGTKYCVNLKNGAAVLSQYCFDANVEIESVVPMTPTLKSFTAVVPYPAGLNRVELTSGDGTLLSSRVASSSPPTVTIQFPNAPGLSLSGPQTVRWTAGDPDGDALEYSLLYSPDNGASWVTVGTSITQTQQIVDFSQMPGGSEAVLKVLATDGFRSAEDVSDNPFAVPNKPPMAVITAPAAGETFTAQSSITLEGEGMDLEDGSLDDSALSWTSNKDGPLGTGQVLEATLSSPGVHTLTLTVTDSAGLTASTTTTVTVAAGAGLLGDYNGNCVIDIGDVQQLAAHWGEVVTDANRAYDLVPNGVIDSADAQFLAARWRQRCS